MRLLPGPEGERDYGGFQVASPPYAAWPFGASGSEIGSLLLLTTSAHIGCSILIGPFLVGVIIDLAGNRVPIAIMAGLLAIGVAIAVEFAVTDARPTPVRVAA